MTEIRNYENNWQKKAEQNTEKWGNQPPADVVLAMMEELGEIAEELLEEGEPPVERYNRHERELLYLLTEIAALGSDVQSALELSYEDNDGKPLPEDERPEIFSEISEVETIIDELDDLAPLVYQLRESVDNHDST